MNTVLAARIVNICKQHQRPLRTPIIEAYLTIEDDNNIDTFDVRACISNLVAVGQLEYVHPGYLVQLPPTSIVSVN